VRVVWYYAGWHLAVIRLERVETPAAAALRIGLLLLSLAAADRLTTAPRADGPREQVDAG
jgi:hypothetical protein